MNFLSEDNFFNVKFILWGMFTFNFNLSKTKCKTWSERWTYQFPNTYE